MTERVQLPPRVVLEDSTNTIVSMRDAADRPVTMGIGTLPAAVQSLVEGAGKPSQRGQKALGGFIREASTPGYDNRTYQLATDLESSNIIAVRPVIRNLSATAWTLQGLLIASSNTVSALPSGAWRAATFAGATSVAVTARLASGRPSRTFGDWVRFTPVARSDGDTRPLVYFRSYINLGPHSQFAVSTQWADSWAPGANAAQTLGRIIKQWSQAGDFVTSNTAGFSPTDTNGSFGSPSIDFEYMTASGAVFTLFAVGDSLAEGGSATPPTIAPGHFASGQISTLTRPVEFANLAVSSATGAEIYSRFVDMMASDVLPQVIAYNAFSVNDVAGDGLVTTARLDLMMARTMGVIDICAQRQIPLMLGTSIPYFFDASNDANRRAFDVEVKALASPRVLIADRDALLSDGGSPARIKTPLYADTSGALHPNAAGYEAEGRLVWRPLLQTLVDSYFDRAGSS